MRGFGSGANDQLTRLERHLGVMPHMDMSASKGGTSGRRDFGGAPGVRK